MGIHELAGVEPVPLTRALEPFPVPVRTFDALHLASLDYLLQNGQRLELASYDRRMLAVANAMAVSVVDLDSQRE